jgi:Membrane bound beta barrel domain (DUF5777)
MKKIIAGILLSTISFLSNGQEDSLYKEPIFVEEESNEIEDTYLSTRIVNGHSIETLKKGTLEFRIEHKFGDAAGDLGGINTLYGLDNATDIRFAFEYGLTNNLMIGAGRSRGAGNPYSALLDGFIKYRIVKQNKTKIPVSITYVGTTSYSYMTASALATDVSFFPKWYHRMAYSSQLNIAKKIYNKLSLAVIPSIVYRNYVAADDQNLLFSLGSAINYAINTKVNFGVEYYSNYNKKNTRLNYQNSFSVGVDWITFGHTFKVFLTNATGLGETQFIPYTPKKWSKGEFRIGFCVGRKYIRE